MWPEGFSLEGSHFNHLPSPGEGKAGVFGMLAAMGGLRYDLPL